MVDGIGIGHARQQEVGITGINLLAEGQLLQGGSQLVALADDVAHPSRHAVGLAEDAFGLLTSELVDIVGVLDLVEELYYLLASKSHAQTYGRAGPCLAHRIEDNEIGIKVEVEAEGTLVREV